MKIKTYMSYNSRNNTQYYEYFEVVNELPQIGEVIYKDPFQTTIVIHIVPTQIDIEQPNDSNFEYDYYTIITKDCDEYDNIINTNIVHICIKKQ